MYILFMYLFDYLLLCVLNSKNMILSVPVGKDCLPVGFLFFSGFHDQFCDKISLVTGKYFSSSRITRYFCRSV